MKKILVIYYALGKKKKISKSSRPLLEYISLNFNQFRKMEKNEMELKI